MQDIDPQVLAAHFNNLAWEQFLAEDGCRPSQTASQVSTI